MNHEQHGYLSYPIVFGNYAGEQHATLCARRDDYATYHMWYVGRIVHDDVYSIVQLDGSYYQVPLAVIEEFQRSVEGGLL